VERQAHWHRVADLLVNRTEDAAAHGREHVGANSCSVSKRTRPLWFSLTFLIFINS
jgi:hypothetical protein